MPEPEPETTTPPHPPTGTKPCTLCHTPRQVLVRCQTDASGKWNFLCPGRCWISVSGGVEDARGFEGEFPFYRYGGMWKNKHADGPVSARKPKRVKERQRRGRRRAGEEVGGGGEAGGAAEVRGDDEGPESSKGEDG